MPFGPWPGSSGGGTLAKIYAFGLADNPPVDNVFDTTGYQQTFPLSDANANDYVMGTFEKVLNGQSNTFVNYWRRKGDHTINTEKVFNILSINDPTWNGSGDTLAPVQTWTAEKIYYGAEPDNTRSFGNPAFLGGRFWTWQDGGSFTYTDTPGRGWTLGPGKNLSRDQWGWNHIFSSAQQTQRQSGYGYIINQLQVDQHGVAASHLEQVRYGSLSSGGLLPGDGLAYMFAVGSLFDLNGTNIKGWFGIRSPDDAEGSADNSSWYGSIAASKGAPDDLTLATEVAQFWARGSLGMLLQLGGIQYPNSDSTTFQVSDAASARVIYDDNLKQMVMSVDGLPYSPFGDTVTFDSGITNFLTAGPTSFAIPFTRSGFYFVYTSISLILLSYAGTATSNLVINVGNNGSHNNVTPAVTTSATTLNAFGAGVPVQLALIPNVLPGQTMVDAGTEIKFVITVPTGVTTATGRILVQGYWAKI